MQIKILKGRLDIGEPLDDMIAAQCEKNNINLLTVTLGHIYRLQYIADHHKDPFDRLLMAQSVVEQSHFVSCDSAVACYSDQINIIW